MWIVLISFLLCFDYVRRITGYRKAWIRLLSENPGHPSDPYQSTTDIPFFSVIIAFRNEEANMADLIHHLSAQSLEKNMYEVILVDDHSEDDGFRAATYLIRNLDNFSCHSLPPDLYSKKAAITYGIEKAAGSVIVTTDADCRQGPQWLQTLHDFYTLHEPVLVSGPVALEGNGSFFGNWQEMEFAGLIAIGAAAIQKAKPNMCNGANLSYRKDIFYEAGGFKDNEHLLSGDDEFLMHKVHQRYPERVRFMPNAEVIVRTNAAPTLKAFIRQRVRWVSKSSYYKDKRITLHLLLSYLFIIQIPLYLILAFWFPDMSWLALAVFLSKAWSEYFFFKTILPFFRKDKLLVIFLPAEALHVLYVSLIGVLGPFASYTWKGRSQ